LQLIEFINEIEKKKKSNSFFFSFLSFFFPTLSMPPSHDCNHCLSSSHMITIIFNSFLFEIKDQSNDSNLA